MAEDKAELFARNIAFEWDDNKRRSNVRKHGIDFHDARDVFSDPFAYTYASSRSANEQRYVTVGIAKGVLMAVISTQRDKVTRIISARAARHRERQMYDRESSQEES